MVAHLFKLKLVSQHVIHFQCVLCCQCSRGSGPVTGSFTRDHHTKITTLPYSLADTSRLPRGIRIQNSASVQD